MRGLVCNLETLDERPELREFKWNALSQLAELLRAVAVYAAGGIKALAARHCRRRQATHADFQVVGR